MKPLFVLLGAFIAGLMSTYYFTGSIDYPLSGRIALSAMLLFTSIAHFAFVKGMTMMVPDFIPFKKEIVYATGIIEIIAAVCLLVPSLKTMTGWALIVFFIVLLPGNINAAKHHIDYQKGTYDGHGLSYLWFRIPLQLLFIAVAYEFAVRF